MASAVDLVVRATPEYVAYLVNALFRSHEFAVRWHGPTWGTAEKWGNSAFAVRWSLFERSRLCLVDFLLIPGQGQVTLRLAPGNTGAPNLGLLLQIGHYYDEVVHAFHSWFAQWGLLAAAWRY